MKKRKQETVKCFVTTCKFCNESVMYWEGSRGSKMFFNFPIYGKFIQHLCKKREKIWVKPESAKQKRNKKQIDKSTIQCPVCSKKFKTKQSITAHIKNMKKIDNLHHEFFDVALDFIQSDVDSFVQNQFQKSDDNSKNKGEPIEEKYGRVYFKNLKTKKFFEKS